MKPCHQYIDISKWIKCYHQNGSFQDSHEVVQLKLEVVERTSPPKARAMSWDPRQSPRTGFPAPWNARISASACAVTSRNTAKLIALVSAARKKSDLKSRLAIHTCLPDLANLSNSSHSFPLL